MIVARITTEVIDTTTGQPLIQVANSETVPMTVNGNHGIWIDTLTAVLERLSDDVKGRVIEQVQQGAKT